MLASLLDPFDRAVRLTRRDCHQHDIGKDRMLDGKAAAQIGWRLDPSSIVSAEGMVIKIGIV